MDLTAIAAHELDLVILILEVGGGVVPGRGVFEVDLAGTGRGVAGFGVGGVVGVIIHGGGGIRGEIKSGEGWNSWWGNLFAEVFGDFLDRNGN